MGDLLELWKGKIPLVPNNINQAIIAQALAYMERNDASTAHMHNFLKVVIPYGISLGENKSFTDVCDKLEILSHLDSKKKSKDKDPDEKWITTWNHHLSRIKFLYRWIYNQRDKKDDSHWTEWETPAFVKIMRKRTKRQSPYSESEIWSRDDLLVIIKYAAHVRNKAALGLTWDFDARPHEVIKIKIKNITLKEKYGEGEVPFEAKTGSGPVLLTLSFPYVREWLKVHPFKHNAEARLICNIYTGAPVKSRAMWNMMQDLRERIVRLIKSGEIKDREERKRLEVLLRTKKWNPYCLRHSAITYDSDYLPGYALNKKVRWSMNSKQPARYIKNRMGNDLKRQILAREGIIDETVKDKPVIRLCAKCGNANAIEYDCCTECNYPLTPQAMEKVRQDDQATMQKMVEDKIQEGIAEFIKNNPEAVFAIREKAKKEKTFEENKSQT